MNYCSERAHGYDEAGKKMILAIWITDDLDGGKSRTKEAGEFDIILQEEGQFAETQVCVLCMCVPTHK